MTKQEMIEAILNSPIADSRGAEKVKAMIDRHGDDFLIAMYQALVDSEEHLMFS